MKNLIFLLYITFSVYNVSAQDSRKDPLYKKYPELPAFNILQPDSLHIFNTYTVQKGRPVAIILFDPSCKHCKELTDALMKGMDSISNIDFYFVTPAPRMSEIKQFAAEHQFEKYPNVKMCGKDTEFFFIDYFGVNSFPDAALYDADKKFVHLFQGRFTVQDFYEYTHKK